jgi:hypothetical protein
MRVLVLETITINKREHIPGRVIRTSTPEKFIEKYGKKVCVWHNWPQPMEEDATGEHLQDTATAPEGAENITPKKLKKVKKD